MSLNMASPFPMAVAQTKIELVRLVRIPAFSIISLVLPIMFYAFFGLPQAHQHFQNTTVGLYMLGSYSAYAILSIALISFGASIANERGTGAMRLIRATPLPAIIYLIAKTLSAMAFAALSMTLLTLFAVFVAHVPVTPQLFATLLMRLLLGSIPFTMLGFAVGYLVSLNTAIAVLNMINIIGAFASGLFIPVADLPPFVAGIAPYTPAYHFGQLAWGAVGAANEPLAKAALWLLGYGIAFLFLAIRAYGREERKEFA